MRLDPHLSRADIETILTRQARDAFGSDYAGVLSDALHQTAECLVLICRQPLDLDDEAPDVSGIDDGGCP